MKKIKNLSLFTNAVEVDRGAFLKKSRLPNDLSDFVRAKNDRHRVAESEHELLASLNFAKLDRQLMLNRVG
jgi:hypothetical protein